MCGTSSLCSPHYVALSVAVAVSSCFRGRVAVSKVGGQVLLLQIFTPWSDAKNFVAQAAAGDACAMEASGKPCWRVRIFSYDLRVS